MTDTLFQRYAPSASAKLQPLILAALADGKWHNSAAICATIRRTADDGQARYCLKRMADAGEIERKTTPNKNARYGFTYLFRRKP